MRKKVIHVCGFGTGGIQNVVYSICENSAKEVEYYIFGRDLGDEENNIKRYEKLNINVIKAQRGKIKYVKCFIKAIKTVKPDCVHLHQMYSSGTMALISKILGVKKIIVQSHNTNTKNKNTIIRNLYKKIMKKFISLFATDWIAVSSISGEELFNKKILSSDRYHLILNGIDIKKFEEKPKKQFEHKFVDEKNKLIVTIGRITKQKNYEFTIKIMRELVKKDKNFKLIIAGDGEDREKIENMICEFNLTDNIDIIGFTEQIPELLHTGNLFLLPSLWEGFGIVFLEAQVANIPCIASTNVPKEVNIGLMEYCDLNLGADVWAQKCINALKQNNKRIDEKLKSNMSVEYMVKQYMSIYS